MEQAAAIWTRAHHLAECWQNHTRFTVQSTVSSLTDLMPDSHEMPTTQQLQVPVCNCPHTTSTAPQPPPPPHPAQSSAVQLLLLCPCPSQTSSAAQNSSNRQRRRPRACQNKVRAITPPTFSHGTGTAVHTGAVESEGFSKQDLYLKVDKYQSLRKANNVQE